MGVVEAVTNSNCQKKLPKMFLINYDGSPYAGWEHYLQSRTGGETVRALVEGVCVQEEELIPFSILQSNNPKHLIQPEGQDIYVAQNRSELIYFRKPTTQSFSPISFPSPPPNGNRQSHA